MYCTLRTIVSSTQRRRDCHELLIWLQLCGGVTAALTPMLFYDLAVMQTGHVVAAGLG